ncbi:ATP-binding protein [Streptomyces pathocidini]|uniref:ATP-binding protein n=2 Tax=Streptomyces pathocidini TaxID=1650571 RepID=A0ABW7UWT5_9ACTN
MHHTQNPGTREAALPHIPEGAARGGAPGAPAQVPGAPAQIPAVPRQDTRIAGPWQLPGDPVACRRARSAVRSVLAEWHLDHLSHTAELLVSELVGNALRHTEGPLQLTLERRPALRCRVEDGSRRMPRRRTASPEDEDGRGLELVHLMSSEWGVDHTARGKSVWFELR